MHAYTQLLCRSEQRNNTPFSSYITHHQALLCSSPSFFSSPRLLIHLAGHKLGCFMLNTTTNGVQGWLMILLTLLPLAISAGARRPVVKTIQISNGDIIDCVDIYKQPAFDHPLLKNHTIQMPTTGTSSMQSDGSNSSKQYADFMCQECKSCPEGTIPILRIMKNRKVYPNQPPDDDRVETATAEMKAGFGSMRYGGVAADISVWKPVVPQAYYSNAKIGVESESRDVQLFAGWTVHPSRFRDFAPRNFIYWEVTEYNQTRGCFNLDCPGFVHVHPLFVLGGRLPSSDPGGFMNTIHLRIHKVSNDRKWWLSFNHQRIGYWPYAILKTNFVAKTVLWEGRVTNKGSGPEAETHMGSGHSPRAGFGRAAHFGNLKYTHRNGMQYHAANLQITKTLPHCYNLMIYDVTGPSFTYGGPGGPHCYQT